MGKIIVVVAQILCLSSLVHAQGNNTLKGTVLDDNRQPLPGCHVHYLDRCVVSDFDGHFILTDIPGEYATIEFSFVGYQPKDTLAALTGHPLIVQLQPAINTIGQVLIKGNRTETEKSLTNELVKAGFLTQNMDGIFIKSLDQISGVNAMDIGANASKPVIRGMSFNRVVVSENGIKQEGQQWGADHGIEMDPFSVESAEIVKGASAIEYGSDAIGGYIHIGNDRVPEAGPIKAEIQTLTKSVNQTLGASVSAEGRDNHFFFKLRGTLLDFGDYHIPTDTIMYLTRKMPVANQQLKNTAGREIDFSAQGGLIYNRFFSAISFSDVDQKSGFFPGSHGIPDLERVKDDGNRRNLEYPYQQADHLKIISNSRYFTNLAILRLDLAFQDNNRREWSQFHTHYPGQSAPAENPDLELDFHLRTHQANLKANFNKWTKHRLSAGIQNQWKDNQIGGYNFLLPEYSQFSTGAFVKDDLQASSKLKIALAIRYDFSRIETTSFFDPILYDYLTETGTSPAEATEYANRSYGVDRTFQDFTWLAGMVFTPSANLVARFNLGKAFRTPTAIELSANGIHHGSFRHEQGTGNLSSEKGYYTDAGLEWKNGTASIGFSPYLYYFSNYIFLNPTGEWSKLPHAGQIYRYTQSKAILSGAELSFQKQFFQQLNVRLNLEYIRNEQITDNRNQRYPLPFTPPPNAFAELEYRTKAVSGRFSDTRLFVNTKAALAQNRVARNEKATPGYQILGAGISTRLKTATSAVEFVLQAHNLFDNKYFNHISFYRNLEIPDPGRNVQLLVKIPISL